MLQLWTREPGGQAAGALISPPSSPRDTTPRPTRSRSDRHAWRKRRRRRLRQRQRQRQRQDGDGNAHSGGTKERLRCCKETDRHGAPGARPAYNCGRGDRHRIPSSFTARTRSDAVYRRRPWLLGAFLLLRGATALPVRDNEPSARRAPCRALWRRRRGHGRRPVPARGVPDPGGPIAASPAFPSAAPFEALLSIATGYPGAFPDALRRNGRQSSRWRPRCPARRAARRRQPLSRPLPRPLRLVLRLECLCPVAAVPRPQHVAAARRRRPGRRQGEMANFRAPGSSGAIFAAHPLLTAC